MKIYEINSTIDIQICIRFTKSNLLNRFSRTCLGAGELGTVLLPAGTDMNNVDTNGRFFLANGLNTAASFSYYEVFNVSMTNNSDCYQIAYVLTTGTPVKTRARINGKWYNWVEK